MAATPTIQRGQITIAAAATSVTVDRGVDSGFDTAVVLTETILWPATWRANDASGTVGTIQGVLTDGNTITFRRNNATTADGIIEWCMSSYASGVVVQHKTGTVAAASASQTVAISAPSISGGRFVLHGGTYTAGTQSRDINTRVSLNSTTEALVSRTTTTSDVEVAFQVIDYDTATVQTITFSRTGTTATTEDETISAVTLANTAVFGSSQHSANVGPPEWKYDLSFTSTTNLRATRITGTSTNLTITAYVVSFSDGTTIQHVANLHSASVTDDTTISAVVLARTVVSKLDVGSGLSWAAGVTATIASRAAGTRLLTTTTNLRTEKASSTTDVTFNSQVIEFAEGGASAAVTGTLATGTRTQADVVAGGLTLLLTLSGDTWVTAGATFDAIRDDIIAGLDAASSPSTGWNTLVRDTLAVTTVVRTSDTVVTVTLPAVPSYAITADEILTVTIPAAALTGGVPIVATPTITIHEGAVLSVYSGTTNGSGVLTTSLTSDQSGVRIKTKAFVGATLVGLTTTRPT